MLFTDMKICILDNKDEINSSKNKISKYCLTKFCLQKLCLPKKEKRTADIKIKGKHLR